MARGRNSLRPTPAGTAISTRFFCQQKSVLLLFLMIILPRWLRATAYTPCWRKRPLPWPEVLQLACPCLIQHHKLEHLGEKRPGSGEEFAANLCPLSSPVNWRVELLLANSSAASERDAGLCHFPLSPAGAVANNARSRARQMDG